MQQFVNLLIGALQSAPVGEPQLVVPHVPSFRDFKAVGPPEFYGTAEPIEAQAWIKEIEKAFSVVVVEEDQKTVFATYLLKGKANCWWETNQLRAGEGIVAWDRFKELFFENYFPKSMQNKMEVKFLKLKQGGRTGPQ